MLTETYRILAAAVGICAFFPSTALSDFRMDFHSLLGKLCWMFPTRKLPKYLLLQRRWLLLSKDNSHGRSKGALTVSVFHIPIPMCIPHVFYVNMNAPRQMALDVYISGNEAVCLQQKRQNSCCSPFQSSVWPDSSNVMWINALIDLVVRRPAGWSLLAEDNEVTFSTEQKMTK